MIESLVPLDTMQVSQSRFSMDGLKHITVKSRAMNRRADITVWLPPDIDKSAELPLVILLHGVYGSHWAWAYCGGAHLTVNSLISSGKIGPIGLVMPSDGLWGDGSGYFRHPNADFERWIVEEVPFVTRQLLPERLRSSSPLFLAGLSMGGYGALRLGARHSEQFIAVSGHSSATEFQQLAEFVEETDFDYGGAPDQPNIIDAVLAHRSTLPAMRFDCGTDDFLLVPNRQLHEDLTSHGIAHEYEEFSGGHEWPYWEEHLVDTLQFFDKHRPKENRK